MISCVFLVFVVVEVRHSMSSMSIDLFGVMDLLDSIDLSVLRDSMDLLDSMGLVRLLSPPLAAPSTGTSMMLSSSFPP